MARAEIGRAAGVEGYNLLWQSRAEQHVLESCVRMKDNKLRIYHEPVQVVGGHKVMVNSVSQPIKSPICIA